ncbi:hypothetical protein [Halobacillus sp. A5]|uniref:hypothetical protein n=1 Tax=Halobacillus sp. A5 TaxID=2880263 RepID=UPI0020A68E68|nr:hypothetical protein [Halobacillus sp. A5]MCP3026510.1 hypothetical protein [Halobacillus sp. A5]
MFGEVDYGSMNYVIFHLFSLGICMVVAGMISMAVLRELRLPASLTGSIASMLSIVVAYVYYQTFF